jgi:hypothetical protein
MASPSKLSLKMSSRDNPKPQVFETFDPTEDYESFQQYLLLTFLFGIENTYKTKQ